MPSDEHHTLARIVRAFGPLDARALAGSACFWAWVDGLFGNVFFGPFGQADAMGEPATWLTSALGVLVAIAFLLRPHLARRLSASAWGVRSLGVAGTLGSLTFVLAAWFDAWPVLVVGAVVCAAFMACAIVLWGAVYCRGGAKTAALYACGGFACAAVPEFAFFALIRPVPAFAFSLLPLASMVLLALLPPEGRAYERALPGQEARTEVGISAGVLCAVVLVMLGFGYMQHLVTFSGMPGLASTKGDVTVQTARVIVAVVLFGITLVVPARAHLVYRAGLLAIVAGFSLMPFLYGSDAFWASGVVIMAGYTAFDVLMWVVVAQVGYARLGDALRAVCVVQLLVKGTFSSLGAAAAIVLQKMGSDAVFACADAIFVGYLMTVAVVLLISNREVWDLFNARRPAVVQAPSTQAGPAERIAALADAYELTDRERQVFAHLAQGRTQPWIAESLRISESTVNSHVRHIYGKLDINSKQELLDLVNRG